jgi:hypothetical protein
VVLYEGDPVAIDFGAEDFFFSLFILPIPGYQSRGAEGDGRIDASVFFFYTVLVFSSLEINYTDTLQLKRTYRQRWLQAV